MKPLFILLIVLITLSSSTSCSQIFSIAGVLPLTGHLSDYSFSGYQFFCNQLNKKGGFSLLHNGGVPFTDEQGKKQMFYFNCTFLDDKSDQMLHLNQQQKLIRDGSVDFLVGGHFSFEYETVSKLMQQTQKLITLCCYPEEDVYRLNNKNVFGISTPSKRVTTSTINSIAVTKIQNISVFYQFDNQFSKSVCESAVAQAEDRRINVSIQQTYNATGSTQNQIIQKIQNLVSQMGSIKSQAIIACVDEDIAEQLTLEIDKNNVPLKLIFLTSAPSLESYSNSGNLSEYVLSASGWHRSTQQSDPFFGNNSNFVQQFFDSYNQTPGTFQALQTATMETYLEAIKTAFKTCDISRSNGNVEQLLYGQDTVVCFGEYYQGYDLVQNALYKININTLIGGIYFDKYGQNSVDNYLTTQILKSSNNPEELESYSVLPVKYADEQIVVPQPNRYPTECEDGFFQPADQEFDDCEACPAGKYRCSTCPQSMCEYCTKTEYSNMTGQSECFTCPQNTEATRNGATSIEECQCKPDYYHPYYQVGRECEECPAGLECPGNNGTVAAQYGYWMTQTLPLTVYHCGPPEICGGGDNHCSTGYDGILCSRCQLGYYNVLRACRKCPSKTIMILQVVGVVVFWWFLNSVLTRHVDCFAVMLNWFQQLRIVGQYSANWPSSIFLVLSLTGLFAFETDFMELSCLYPNWSFLNNFAIQIIQPFVVGFMSFLAYTCSYVYYHYYYKKYVKGRNVDSSKSSISFLIILPKDQSELEQAFNYSIATFLSFISGSFSAIAKDCFASFLCDEIGGEMVVKNNYEVKCGDPQAQLIKGLGIVALLVYMIPYPLYLIISVIQLKRRKAFHDQKYLARLGWFYKMYEVEWYWFELTHLVHRIAFIAIFFFTPSPMMQCIYAIGITIALLLLQIYSRPYIDVHLDILQTFLLIGLMLVCFSGLIFYNPLVLSQDRRMTEIFILCILGLFICIFVGFLMKDLLEKLISVWASCKIKKASVDGLQAVKQLMHVFELRYMLPWLAFSNQREQEEMFLLSQELADYVSNESDTSYLSTTKTGRWWRELSERFPEVIDFLAIVDENTKKNFVNFVEVLYNNFYHHKGEGNIYEMITWQDRAPISQWLTQTSKTNRRLFNDVTLFVFKLVKGHHVAKELQLRMASHGRTLQSQPKQGLNLTKKSTRHLTRSAYFKYSGRFDFDMLTQYFTTSSRRKSNNDPKLVKSAPLPIINHLEQEDIDALGLDKNEVETWIQGKENGSSASGEVKDVDSTVFDLLQYISSSKKTSVRRHNSASGQNLAQSPFEPVGPWERKTKK